MADDLVTSEGVDEGSAAALTGGAEPAGDLVGEAPHGAPASEQDAAPPVSPNEQDPPAGQQLAEGEG